MTTVRIGTGAGFAEDRIDPAVDLARDGQLDFLVFECLAERTIAAAHRVRRADPEGGYDELFLERLEAVLPHCATTRVLTNAGAANPVALGRKVRELLDSHHLQHLVVAVVTGDEVVVDDDTPLLDGGTVADLGDVISANAYLGCEPLVQALEQGAHVVIAGRVADPSLFVAPLVHSFGWALDDWPLLGKATSLGHLLECGAQVTGGYFAEPGRKEVPDLARLGFPLAEVSDDGSFVITKVEGTGGCVTTQTCAEQLMYEVHDPSRYLTPDVTADFSDVTLTQEGPSRVRVEGATGRPRTDSLKVSVGYLDGWVGTGEISYAASGCVARGRLALDVVRQRLEHLDVPVRDLRLDLIGDGPDPAQIRIRVAAKTATRRDAERVGREVTALWLNGPAGGGGATRSSREVLAIASCLVPRDDAKPEVTLL